MLMRTPPQLLTTQDVDAEPIWTAAYLFPGRERRAQKGIEDLGYGTFLPTYVERQLGARGERFVEKPLLGPYLLISINPRSDNGYCEWSKINAIDGVGRVLAIDGRPIRVSDREVAALFMAHALGEFNRTLVKPGHRSPPRPRKPRRSAQQVRAARRARVRLKKWRALRRLLDRALEQSRRSA